ncbi:hypothetical protein TWF481_009314 [Arthrobotrys musiformis]|uniref:ATP-grasp domain-containing protein n=1 Tax=Arthrobotrys musiformis TaxID=47236 RepID=A0AAV9W3G2_9PEZI
MESQAPPRKVLFIKTNVSTVGPTNALLISTLQKRGLQVEKRGWYPPASLTLKDLTSYHSINFLNCWEYNLHITSFYQFLKEVIAPAEAAGVKIVNPVQVLLWNSDKEYLRDLQRDVGINIPESIFVEALPGGVPAYEDVISALDPDGAHGTVIKPSISAASNMTHRIPHPSSESYDSAKTQANWAEVYEYTRDLSSSAKVIIQAFEPAIKNGEYSIFFLGGEYSHTVLKKPAETDYRAMERFGASVSELKGEEVPSAGKEICKKIVEYVERRFGTGDDWRLGYLRVDGVVRDDGTFVVIEAEMLEPYVFLDVEGAKDGLERLCDALGN